MDALSRQDGRLLHVAYTLWLFLLLGGAKNLLPLADAAGIPTVYATPFITADISDFRLGIEGVSVDSNGTMYAVGYLDRETAGLGTFATAGGTVDQELFFMDQTGSSSFNGIRFLPVSNALAPAFLSRAVASDVRNHRLVHLLQNRIDGRVRGYSFCGNDTMAQPNDAAVAPKSGRIYLSGGKYGMVTTSIGDGDLWLCQAPTSFLETSNDQLDTVPAQLLGLFGLTNGIEISPDESTLYLSESFHANGEIVSQKILKFALDPRTGGVLNQTVLVDFQELDGSGWLDLDGIRVDVEGNLFVVRNGPSTAVGAQKISPDGKLLLNIMLPGIKEATNCDFGGPDGTWLFVSGKCVADPNNGCIDVWQGNSVPGRAWAELRSS